MILPVCAEGSFFSSAGLPGQEQNRQASLVVERPERVSSTVQHRNRQIYVPLERWEPQKSLVKPGNLTQQKSYRLIRFSAKLLCGDSSKITD